MEIQCCQLSWDFHSNCKSTGMLLELLLLLSWDLEYRADCRYFQGKEQQKKVLSLNVRSSLGSYHNDLLERKLEKKHKLIFQLWGCLVL